MKTLMMMATVTLVAVAGMLCAQDLSPELAEPAAKYKAAAEALEKGRLAAAAQAAQPYASALDEVKKAAAVKGDVKTAEAATKERDAALAGRLGPELPAGLPALRLQGTRKALLMKLEPVNADFGKRKKRLDGEYLGVLDSLRQKVDPESALAKRIAAEKALLLEAGSAAGADVKTSRNATAKNVVVNGDFEKAVDGKPVEWSASSSVTVLTEKDNTFVRFDPIPNKDGSGPDVWIYQKVETPVPEKAERVTVSARARVANGASLAEKSPHHAYVRVQFHDGDGKDLKFCQTNSREEDKKGVWKRIQNEAAIPAGAVQASLRISNGDCLGQIDFDDVEVTFR